MLIGQQQKMWKIILVWGGGGDETSFLSAIGLGIGLIANCLKAQSYFERVCMVPV